MLSLEYTPLAAMIESHEGFSNSGARQILNEVTLPALYDQGLVTKSHKAHFSWLHPTDRHRSVNRLQRLLQENLKKTRPYLISELNVQVWTQAGVDAKDYNPTIPLSLEKPGLFLVGSTSRVVFTLPIIPFHTLTESLDISWVQRALSRYSLKLVKAASVNHGLPTDVAERFSRLVTPTSRAAFSSSSSSVPYREFLCLEIEFALDRPEDFALFMTLLMDVKSVVKVLRSLTRLRVREARFANKEAALPSFRNKRAPITVPRQEKSKTTAGNTAPPTTFVSARAQITSTPVTTVTTYTNIPPV